MTAVEYRISNIFYAIIFLFLYIFIYPIFKYLINMLWGFNVPNQFIIVISTLISEFTAVYFMFKRCGSDIFNYHIVHTKIVKASFIGLLYGILLAIIQFPYDICFYETEIPSDLYIFPNNGIGFIMPFLLVVIFALPIFEELLFRGYFYNIIKFRFNKFWGYIITALLFALIHEWFINVILKLIICSLILTFAYEKTKHIATCIIAHIFWNLTWYTAIYIKLI